MVFGVSDKKIGAGSRSYNICPFFAWRTGFCPYFSIYWGSKDPHVRFLQMRPRWRAVFNFFDTCLPLADPFNAAAWVCTLSFWMRNRLPWAKKFTGIRDRMAWRISSRFQGLLYQSHIWHQRIRAFRFLRTIYCNLLARLDEIVSEQNEEGNKTRLNTSPDC